MPQTCGPNPRPRPHQAFRQHKQRRQNNQYMFDPTISVGAPYIMRENQARSFQLPFGPLRPRKAGQAPELLLPSWRLRFRGIPGPLHLRDVHTWSRLK